MSVALVVQGVFVIIDTEWIIKKQA
jgi:hypothetical protein